MTDIRVVPGRGLHAGSAQGEVLKLDTPVSFWGGVDPASGCIVDRAHPQNGCKLTGTVLALAGSRGSSGTPGVLGEMLRLGTGPAAIVLTKADVNLVAGALVAATLYQVRCPIILVEDAVFDRLQTGDLVQVGGGA